jgi:hypothetical protein
MSESVFVRLNRYWNRPVVVRGKELSRLVKIAGAEVLILKTKKAEARFDAEDSLYDHPLVRHARQLQVGEYSPTKASAEIRLGLQRDDRGWVFATVQLQASGPDDAVEKIERDAHRVVLDMVPWYVMPLMPQVTILFSALSRWPFYFGEVLGWPRAQQRARTQSGPQQH